MNAATKSRKYLLTNLVSNWTASGTTNSTLAGTATARQFVSTNNVLAFGADPTGVSDSTSAIQAAMANAALVIFPPGQYLSSTVYLTNNTEIVGIGNPIINFTPAITGYLLDGSQATNVFLHGVTLQGGVMLDYASMNYTNNRSGIYFQPKGFRMSDCTVTGFEHYGAVSAASSLSSTYTLSPMIDTSRFTSNWTGLYLPNNQGGEYLRVDNSEFSFTFTGVDNWVGNTFFVNCQFVESTAGLWLHGGSNNGHGSIVGCAMNHVGFGVIAQNVTQGYVIDGCQMWGNTAGVRIDNCAGIKVQNCAFEGNAFQAMGPGTNWNYVTDNWWKNVPTINTNNGSVAYVQFFGNVCDSGLFPVDNQVVGNIDVSGTAKAGSFDIPLLSLGNASSTVVVDFSTLGFRTMNATNDLSISVTNMPASVARTIEYVIYTGDTNRAVTWEAALTNSMGAPLPTILPSNNVVNLTLRSVGTAVTNVHTYVSWRIP